MKSWIILIVVAVATTVTASVAVPLLSGDSASKFPQPIVAAPVDISATAPLVEVDQPLAHVFEVMAQDTEGKHTWMFKNAGKGTLELRNLGSDCSCTVAQIGKPNAADKKTMLAVAPGSAEPIELTWNTRKGDEHYRKNATIGTNDPRRETIVLTIQGKVYPAVTVVPSDSVVSFNVVSNDEDVVRKAAIYSQDRTDMQITRLVSSNPSLIELTSAPMTTEEMASLRVHSGQMITFTLKASDKLGAITEEVLIGTDHPEKPEVKLRVKGQITGPVTFVPDQVVMHDVTRSVGGFTNTIVWVRGRSSTQIKVAKAPPGLDISFTSIPMAAGVPGTKFRMTVKVPPGTPAGQIKDEIVLTTDHPKAGQIRLPVDVLIQDTN